MSTQTLARNGKLDGKVAIVTGSGRGIVRGPAIALAKQGASVVITDINEKTSDAVAQEIRGLGGNALGRFGHPELGGGPIAVFLASSDSDYMTGQTFHVDGGPVIAP